MAHPVYICVHTHARTHARTRARVTMNFEKTFASFSFPEKGGELFLFSDNKRG